MAQKGKRAKASASPKRPFHERNGVLLTLNEAADYLGVTERQMYRLLAEHDVVKTKVRGLLRVHIDDLNAYCDQQRALAVH